MNKQKPLLHSWKKRWAITDKNRPAQMHSERTPGYLPVFFWLAFLFLLPGSVAAQKAKRQKETAPVLTRIEFLFDASQSMYARWQSGMKIDVAKKLMSEMLDSLRMLENI